MDKEVEDIILMVGIIAGLSVTYAKAFGSYQSYLTDAVIAAFMIKSRWKRMTNLAVGVVIATAFTVLGALWVNDFRVIPIGVLAGILASVEAARAYDATKAPRTDTVVSIAPSRPAENVNV